MRFLLAEDDIHLGSALRTGLRMCGFHIDWVQDGVAALQETRHVNYAAVVLDLGMPCCDGFTVLKRLRSAGKKTPILVLTAQDANETITQSLDSGADDYVVKPIDIQVLAARLRALVRRSFGQAHNRLQLGPLSLNPGSREVLLDGTPMLLSTREFDILQALLLVAGRLLTREHLEQQMYVWGKEINSNAVEVHIHNLRKKLGRHKNLIHTVRGVGYKTHPPGSDQSDHYA